MSPRAAYRSPATAWAGIAASIEARSSPVSSTWAASTTEVLVGAGGDQFLVVLFARPGTDAREKLDLLRVIGTQDLTDAPSGL